MEAPAKRTYQAKLVFLFDVEMTEMPLHLD
jgi:hypothetical protein